MATGRHGKEPRCRSFSVTKEYCRRRKSRGDDQLSASRKVLRRLWPTSYYTWHMGCMSGRRPSLHDLDMHPSKKAEP